MTRLFGLLSVSSLLLVLTACGEASDEEVQKVKQALPMGCNVQDLGSYGDVDHLIVVTCNGRNVQTTSWTEPHGKTHSDEASVVIN